MAPRAGTMCCCLYSILRGHPRFARHSKSDVVASGRAGLHEPRVWVALKSKKLSTFMSATDPHRGPQIRIDFTCCLALILGASSCSVWLFGWPA